mgnify:CR=1 FL=1
MTEGVYQLDTHEVCHTGDIGGLTVSDKGEERCPLAALCSGEGLGIKAVLWSPKSKFIPSCRASCNISNSSWWSFLVWSKTEESRSISCCRPPSAVGWLVEMAWSEVSIRRRNLCSSCACTWDWMRRSCSRRRVSETEGSEEERERERPTVNYQDK